MSEQQKNEYIKGLLSIVNEDKKSVLLYVAFDFAVVSLILSNKIFEVNPNNVNIVTIGLVTLLISAVLFFNYYRKMHLACFELAKQLLNLNVERAEQIPKEVWRYNKMKYRLGHLALYIGLVILIISYVS